MNQEEENIKLSGKQKIIVAGGILVGLLAIVVSVLFMSDKESDTDLEVLDGGAHTNVSQFEETNIEPVYVDEDTREGLGEQMTNDLLNGAMAFASTGKWLDIVESIEDYDKSYDIEKDQGGKHLRDIFMDASILSRLQAQGESAEEIEEAKKAMVNLNTPEMFVLGLYFLPRNVLLDLSFDTLALGPTARGYVKVLDVVHYPVVDEDGYVNDKIEQDDVINRYLNNPDAVEFLTDFYRVEVDNDGFEEYAYLGRMDGAPIELIGIYSDESDPGYTTKTVSHYKKFAEMIQEGFDEYYGDETETTSSEWVTVDDSYESKVPIDEEAEYGDE